MTDLTASTDKLKSLIDLAQTILVLQPEKPDTDSLSSSIALEHFLEQQGKAVVMYCQDEIPGYIRSIAGWDRVADKFPSKFDLTILVDTGGPNMIVRTLEKHQSSLTKQPFVIIDHHATREAMPFETLNIIDTSCASTTEQLFRMSKQLGWEIKPDAASCIVSGILADTASFSNTNTSIEVVRAVADLVEIGVSLPELYAKKRALDSLTPELLHFKGKLLQRVEFVADGKVAINYATPEELKQFSEIHDPADLVNKEALFSKGVLVSAFLRDYGPKIKISMRAEIDGVNEVAKSMGGGGHSRAAGIRVDGQDLETVKATLREKLEKLVEGHDAKTA